VIVWGDDLTPKTIDLIFFKPKKCHPTKLSELVKISVIQDKTEFKLLYDIVYDEFIWSKKQQSEWYQGRNFLKKEKF